MDTRRVARLLIVAAALTAASSLDAWAEARGTADAPAFTPEETALIARDSRLVAAAREYPEHLRCALDAWNAIRGGARAPAPCPELPPEPGRASTEGPFDLLQILKEAAGGGPKR